MRIRIKQEQVVPLLKHLNYARENYAGERTVGLASELDNIKTKLQAMSVLLPRVKDWEEKLVGQFHDLRQHIYCIMNPKQLKDFCGKIDRINVNDINPELPKEDIGGEIDRLNLNDDVNPELPKEDIGGEIGRINVNDINPELPKEDNIGGEIGRMDVNDINPELPKEDIGGEIGPIDVNDICKLLKCIDSKIDSITKIIKTLPDREEQPSSSNQQSRPEEAQPRKWSKEWSELHMPEMLLVDPAMENLRLSYDHLESLQLKLCLLCFSIFPENSVVKKRPLIYWWIGEGLVAKTQDKTADQVGEDVFQELMKQGLITPHHKSEKIKSKPIKLVNSCRMRPWTLRMLISVAKEADFFEFDSDGTLSGNFSKSHRACLVAGKHAQISSSGDKQENLLTVFNVNEPYPSLKREWLLKLKRAEVLQLGRWQASPTHHIEVESLSGLGAQKLMKYLSLRGISRINELPPVVGLVSLEILDLRACHNLEKLPSDITLLKKLTHLDVSECYLLDSMPKGLEKLTSLQVLKGFVIGDLERTPCRIGDLVRLKKLRKLSVNIGSEAVIREGEFAKFKEIQSLCSLTISWGVVKIEKGQEDSMNSLSFPPQLSKLDIRCLPQGTPPGPPKWLKPSKLERLEKLYIKGGSLSSLDHGETNGNEWKVKILRLQYLTKLKITNSEVLEKFPQLLYLEKVERGERNEDDIVSEWNKDEEDKKGNT